MGPRREARLKRQAAALLKNQEKSARLRESITPQNKEVRTGGDPDSIFQQLMTWTGQKSDCEGDWSWGPRGWSVEDWDQQIHPKLTNWQTMRWHEIEGATTDNGHRMHHDMDCGDLCNEALERLFELKMYTDTIYRFRMGNRRRLWGFRILSEFQILWYDPTHNIYPTDPD